jgi:hypothetical protein
MSFISFGRHIIMNLFSLWQLVKRIYLPFQILEYMSYDTLREEEGLIVSVKCESFMAIEARLPPNADSARPHHNRHRSLICISCFHNCHRQKLISILSASHERRTRTVKRDGQWLLY